MCKIKICTYCGSETQTKRFGDEILEICPECGGTEHYKEIEVE